MNFPVIEGDGGFEPQTSALRVLVLKWGLRMETFAAELIQHPFVRDKLIALESSDTGGGRDGSNYVGKWDTNLQPNSGF